MPNGSMGLSVLAEPDWEHKSGNAVMLTIEEARHRGFHACIDLLGRSFVEEHKHQGCIAWGLSDEHVHCFVAIGDMTTVQRLLLDSTSKWQCVAECDVSLVTGDILNLRKQTI